MRQVGELGGRRAPGAGLVLRGIGMAVLVIGSLLLLREELGGIRAAEVMERLAALPLPAVAGAILLVAASFAAMACYDLLAFRQIGRVLPVRDALRAGAAATAIAQGVGFGLLTGAMVRWRMYRGHGVGAAEAGLASMVVTAGFFGGLTVFVAGLGIVAPAAVAAASGLSAASVQAGAALVLVLAGGVTLAAVLRPGIRVGRFALRMPGPRMLGGQVGLAMLDLLPAGLALWLLLPGEPSPASFLAVFAIAVAAGLISNAPGGIGAFEVTIFAGLPHLPRPELAAALLAYRLFYHGLPLLAGMAVFLHAELTGPARPARQLPSRPLPRVFPAVATGAVPGPVRGILARGARAESQLSWLGDKDFLVSRDGRAFVMLRAAGGCLVVMGDPVGARAAWPGLIAGILREARRRDLRPAFYRCGPDCAAILRRFGLKADLLGAEAVLPLAGFSAEGAARRELRRRLRQAEKAGVTLLRHAPGQAPLDRLLPVARTWQEARGGETGFSMGTCDPAYLGRFPIWEARQDGRTLGFISVWTSGDGRESSLDLLRILPDAPAGTMQALITSAAEEARAQGSERFSLCMAPLFGLDEMSDRLFERLGARFLCSRRGAALAGLARFKQIFRPDWEPRYLFTTARVLPVFEVLAIRRAIRRGGAGTETAGLVPDSLGPDPVFMPAPPACPG